LTVVKALMRRLPHEDIVYFGDTARVPYGTKSREAIIRFSKENVALLRKRGVKMIVVACNSSSSHALAALHETFDLPIIGVIEPGCRAAAKATKNKKVGIIATPIVTLIRRSRSSIRPSKFSQACRFLCRLLKKAGQQNR
jgi:glutamate racemase